MARCLCACACAFVCVFYFMRLSIKQQKSVYIVLQPLFLGGWLALILSTSVSIYPFFSFSDYYLTGTKENFTSQNVIQIEISMCNLHQSAAIRLFSYGAKTMRTIRIYVECRCI